DGDLPHPVLVAVLVELRRDAPPQQAADEDLDETGEEVGLRDDGTAAVAVVDLDVVLLETEPLRVARVRTLRDHDQLRHAEVDHLRVRLADADELALEVEFLQRLDADVQASVGLALEAAVLVRGDAVVGEELHAPLAPRVL